MNVVFIIGCNLHLIYLASGRPLLFLYTVNTVYVIICTMGKLIEIKYILSYLLINYILVMSFRVATMQYAMEVG